MPSAIRSTRRSRVTDNNSKLGWIAGLYVQDEWRITNQLTLNAGLRFDQMWQYVDANQLSPRFNVVYKPLDGTTLHAGYARYFTPPPQAIAAPANIAPFANTTAQPDTFQQSPVLPERAHYFDAGIVQRITPQLEVGLDAYYKISRDLLDDGQFGAALILSGFNYEKAYNSGVELSATYKDGNFSAYGNLAWARQVATNIVSNQYLFGADELAYIASNYINTDHAQQWTGSAGASYLWHDTRFSASMVYGSGLRSGFANTDHVAALRHGQYRHLARDQAARRQAGHGPLRCRERLRHHLRAQGRLGHRRIRAAIRRAARLFRRDFEETVRAVTMTQTDAILVRLVAAARTRLGMRVGLHRGRRRSSGLAVRHRADAANGKLDFQLRSTGNGGMHGGPPLPMALTPKSATSNCHVQTEPRIWPQAERTKTAMKFCRKLIHLPSTSAVAFAAILLLPAFAFAQVPPAPATAPPAVAVPATPPAQPVPAAKAPIAAGSGRSHAGSNRAARGSRAERGGGPPTAIALTLPRDLSPWGMFMAADIVVKAVMVGLAFASLLTWTIWFAKAFELLAARRQLRRAIEALNEARSLADAMTRLNGRGGDVAMLLRATETELRLSADAISAEGVKERIASRLERIEAAAGRRMIRGTGILATVGATAPFVGLFGTVWGIMNSFIGISKQHTTNLAVVAPGIAEALLATALGLVAAIPAVVMYNMFSRWTAGYRALQADAAAEILRLASRDLDRGALNRPPGERRRPIAAVE